MKLAIIGGNGLLGSTTAFLAAQKGLFEEIKLLGRRKNLLANHAMDMEHALMPSSNTKVTVAEYEEIGDCDIILVTAAAPEREVVSREEYLKDNIMVMKEVADNINKYNNHAIIITATNPVDVFNYFLYKELNRDRMKMLGFASNDSLRLRWAISKELNLDFNKIEAYCIGEHGEGQLPLRNYIKYDGKKLDVDIEFMKNTRKKLLDWFVEFQKLNAKRTSGWTSAVTLTEILESIVLDNGRIIECSIPLDGELSYEDVSIGMMVKLGKNGVKEIIVPELTADEKHDLDATVEKIKKQIRIIS